MDMTIALRPLEVLAQRRKPTARSSTGNKDILESNFFIILLPSSFPISPLFQGMLCTAVVKRQGLIGNLCSHLKSLRSSQLYIKQTTNKDLLYIRVGEGDGTPLQYSCLENPTDGGAWQAAVHGVAKSQTRLNDFTFTFHFHALEKEMATHSSVLAWRIPGTGEPGGLPSMGSRRIGHD